LHATVHETSSRLQPDRHSNWNRLIGVRVWVQRFIEKCMRKREDRCSGDISYSEIMEAETAIIKKRKSKLLVKNTGH